MDIRDNWRILMLVVVCVIAALALFGPLGASQPSFAGNDGAGFNSTEDAGFADPTNLQYGLQLSGGARIRGQLVGMTAENVDFPREEEAPLENTVAQELELESIDVRARAEQGTVEVYSENRSAEDISAALDAAGYDVASGDIRSGVTQPTRDVAVETLTDRLDRTGLSGANVAVISTAGGDKFIVAEAPGITLDQLKAIATDPGRVQIMAGYPEETDNGTELRVEELLTSEDFATIDSAQPGESGSAPNVPVRLTSSAGERYLNTMVDAGFTTEGVGRCTFDDEVDDGPNEGEYCLYTVVDGEYVYGASMSQSLANTLNNQQQGFLNNPRFVMNTGSFEEAQRLQINLRAGALPTKLDVQTETFISPSLAQLFKPLALLTGLIAWLAVSAVVYYWYRDVRIAVPMLLTASSEVFILLGFAAGIGMALDLSHIAGLIAVIGTGLDDLLIMADEILQRKKEVSTGRVFQSRFRKAFWVIGMAAATTIIAMSPLAILSLGELQGFAIITIVGVIVGVAITRPAYGDVLRNLMLEDVKRK
jgi:preprotein translocase subunit SecD